MSREDEAFWRALTRARLDVLLRREGGELRIRRADLLDPFAEGGPVPFNNLGGEARLAVTRRLVRGIIEELRVHCRQWTADHLHRVVQLAAAGSSGSRVELTGAIA